MKTKILKSIVCVVLVLPLLASTLITKHIEDPITIVATYDGFDDLGYTFSYSSKGELESITFESVKEEFIKKYKLEEESTIGKKFELVYSANESEDDEDFSTELVLNSLKLIE